MTTQKILGQQVRLLSMSLLSALLLLSGLMPLTGASAAEKRDADLGAWCQKQGKEAIFYPGDVKKNNVNAKSWRCAKETYVVNDGVEVGVEVNAGASISAEGPSIGVGGSESGSQSSSTSTQYTDITSIDMGEVCRDQFGDEWSAHIDDWSNPYDWKCVRE